ncbi:hypothetical protein DFP72DRAFT_1126785 [Ephemerocybe angulata]|uniref:Uncharacterized protein n=1 Tax=Ephemerocybe angulata TaxID=980116 RepID=A0A8H6M5N8_9AGAR|nr:hypothetical protein DFP72DRAFT_1126785 [Tulosesus angulatus]
MSMDTESSILALDIAPATCIARVGEELARGLLKSGPQQQNTIKVVIDVLYPDPIGRGTIQVSRTVSLVVLHMCSILDEQNEPLSTAFKRSLTNHLDFLWLENSIDSRDAMTPRGNEAMDYTLSSLADLFAVGLYDVKAFGNILTYSLNELGALSSSGIWTIRNAISRAKTSFSCSAEEWQWEVVMALINDFQITGTGFDKKVRDLLVYAQDGYTCFQRDEPEFLKHHRELSLLAAPCYKLVDRVGERELDDLVERMKLC